MARLFADEDFDYPVVRELRQMGHDVYTVQEAGHAGVDDSVVLALAVGDGRAVLTCNRRDFIRLHRQNAVHAGIITCTRGKDFAALANRVHQAISTYPTLVGQLIRIVRPPRP
jgi:hypothetical protein